jgi:hypothetical protein
MAVANLLGSGASSAMDSGLLGAAQAQGQQLLAQQTAFGMMQAKQEAAQTEINSELKVMMNAADISAK